MTDTKTKLILITLAALSVLTFYLRVIPMLTLGDASPLTLLAPDDPYYNLRLIELYVHTGHYQWFDPLTYFPYGIWLNWGPMFTVVCATACSIVGAATPAEIAYVSMFIPAAMASACIPVAYLLGREIGTWKTGIIAAVMMTFIGGQFFHRSVVGYLDHHTAEVLFSLLFIAVYVWAIKHRDGWLIKSKNTLLPGIPCVATAVSFLLLVYTMPTAILFAFAAFVFTVVWLLWHKPLDKPLAYLNAVSFTIVVLIYTVTIPWTTGVNLYTYSIAHILAYIALAGIGIVFVIRDGKYSFYILAGVAVVATIFETSRNLIVGSISQFFGQTKYTMTVQEARGWSFNDAMSTFGIGIPLTLFGIIVLLYKVYKDRKPEILFVATWAILVSIATIQHIRYEYYIAPVIAICSAYVLSAGLDVVIPTRVKEPETRQQKKRIKPDNVKHDKTIRVILSLVTVGILVYFCAVSGVSNYAFSSHIKFGTPTPWVESLTWMKSNTPDTGMDFSKVYESSPIVYYTQKYNYTYEAYGVMSWWDYGHIIEYYANRPVTANPFQAGVIGEYGAARFFIAGDESESVKIAEKLRVKYIVTDIEMATGKFWAMATWADEDTKRYQDYIIANDGTHQITKLPYYTTTIARLHMFDGTYREGQVAYVEYNENHQMTYGNVFNTTIEATAFADTRVSMSNYAMIGMNPASPAGTIPALKHFRLVYESTGAIEETNTLRYVKIFEFVNGANIEGNGVIYTKVTTNTGREFIYAQQSENGSWTLPYSGVYTKEDGSTVVVSEGDVA